MFLPLASYIISWRAFAAASVSGAWPGLFDNSKSLGATRFHAMSLVPYSALSMLRVFSLGQTCSPPTTPHPGLVLDCLRLGILGRLRLVFILVDGRRYDLVFVELDHGLASLPLRDRRWRARGARGASRAGRWRLVTRYKQHEKTKYE